MTPVTVITGVVSGNRSDNAQIDFYRASLPGVGVDEFLGEIVGDLGGSVAPVRIPTWGYDQVHEVRNGESRVCLVRHGGNSGAPISVEADGFASRAFAEVVRRRWPDHRVTNIHSALDFDGASIWPRMVDLHFDIGHDWPSLHRSEVGCFFSGKGASLYQGAPSSAVRTVLYQKGMQKEYRHYNRPNWCRAEVRYRPQKDLERAAAARMRPGVVWAAARHSRLIYERMMGFGPGEIIRETPRETDLQRRFAAMVRQYERTMVEAVAQLGSWDAFGEAVKSGRLPSAKQIGGSET